MDKELLTKYAPSAVVIIAIIIQWGMFVTPKELEIKHREIISEISEKYVTKNENQSQKDELKEMKEKINQIYDILIKKGV